MSLNSLIIESNLYYIHDHHVGCKSCIHFMYAFVFCIVTVCMYRYSIEYRVYICMSKSDYV